MKPRIVVIGVGGAGGNAVNNMIAAGLQGAEFIVANTDAQALETSGVERRIQLGARLTEGLGAGSKPEIGHAAAEEAIEEIRAALAGCHMLFIAAGMGGGTGTGAASVIARLAREFDILTVAVVTKPFQFEGSRRMRIAEAGIAELKDWVDTLLVIPNQNLFRIVTDRTTFAEAFVLADQVLYSGVACIVDLIVKEGLINLDLADVKTVLVGMGTAMMGTGEAGGEQRAIVASEEAIVNPLLDDITLKGARSLLLSITGGRDLTLWEVDEAANRVRQEVDPDANIIVGATFDDSLGDKVRVSIVASGMGEELQQMRREERRHTAAKAGPWPPVARVSPDFRHRLTAAIDDRNALPGTSTQAVAETAWRAPGDVFIREAPALGAEGAETHGGFARRPPWGEAAAADQRLQDDGDGGPLSPPSEVPKVYRRHAEMPPARSGLLRRLAGVGRSGRGVATPEGPMRAAPSDEADEVELPVFFGRSKR
jgi:cell division protein FtsZ